MQKEVIALILFTAPFVFAECVEPIDGMKISESMTFCGDTYDVLNGISIVADNVVLDCGESVLRGTLGESEIGLRLENVNNVTVRKCNILTFNQGVFLRNVTSSLIEKNAILKNRIGIRLLDSYENIIRDNNDKSHQFAVSAVNSKYNIIMFGNREVERGFCDVNACNEFRDMNPCEAGDFYCSKKCTPETDTDCGKPAETSVELAVPEGKTAEQIEREVRQQLETSPEKPAGKKIVPIWIFIYGFAALIAIIAIIAFVGKKKR